MIAGGVIKSDFVRHPLEPMHPATREGLLELAREAESDGSQVGKVATGPRGNTNALGVFNSQTVGLPRLAPMLD